LFEASATETITDPIPEDGESSEVVPSIVVVAPLVVVMVSAPDVDTTEEGLAESTMNGLDVP
jgi:hypothetical protein